ncbi:hypothetical protein PPROV_000886400 [Pycnococcus provasolii]|uniref:DM10 domain-containing protein n=1 Tax=Pycnococcus provasolii TaxID=41880 RepID=A0A830HSP6_9CHLO|nr:hypothetical protein PPROV_000886400 [Pycnococcus provasolii]
MGAVGERLAFLTEWLDPHASLVFTYQLVYHLVDDTIEMYDLRNRRPFLKRMPYPAVSADMLYLGANVTIHGRLHKVASYADEYTKSKVEGGQTAGTVLVPLTELGSTLDALQVRAGALVRDIACFADAGTGAATAALSVSVRGNATLADVCAENKLVAREDATGAGAKALASNALTTKALASCDNTTALCIIKPHAVLAKLTGSILQAIVDAGFDLKAVRMLTLDRANASEFLEVYKGVVPEYAAMVDELVAGPLYAVEVGSAGPQVVESLRMLAGPPDPEVGRLLRPNSLRARFGLDKVRNAVHTTDLEEDGELETRYFFQIL